MVWEAIPPAILQLVSRSHLCQQCCVLHGFPNSMQFSLKKSLTAVELQGLPSLILQPTGNHRGLLNNNTNCSSYTCHQIFQVYPSVSVTPNWHLLTPSNINLYTRKVSPLYLLVLWPLHTNAYMLYLISPWTFAELSGVYLVSDFKMENPPWPVGCPAWRGSATPATEHFVKVLIAQPSGAGQGIPLFTHPAWSYCSQAGHEL